jgi:hypothetical protein
MTENRLEYSAVISSLNTSAWWSELKDKIEPIFQSELPTQIDITQQTITTLITSLVDFYKKSTKNSDLKTPLLKLPIQFLLVNSSNSTPLLAFLKSTCQFLNTKNVTIEDIKNQTSDFLYSWCDYLTSELSKISLLKTHKIAFDSEISEDLKTQLEASLKSIQGTLFFIYFNEYLV